MPIILLDGSYTYWQHVWTGTCHRALPGEEWGSGLWEQITKEDYDDWVLMRQAMWLWTAEQIQELQALDDFIFEASQV